MKSSKRVRFRLINHFKYIALSDLVSPASDETDHNWGEIDKDAPDAEEVTSRLALCNMDWDRISAQDILVILNSFKPTGSVIKTVTVSFFNPKIKAASNSSY